MFHRGDRRLAATLDRLHRQPHPVADRRQAVAELREIDLERAVAAGDERDAFGERGDPRLDDAAGGEFGEIEPARRHRRRGCHRKALVDRHAPPRRLPRCLEARCYAGIPRPAITTTGLYETSFTLALIEPRRRASKNLARVGQSVEIIRERPLPGRPGSYYRHAPRVGARPRASALGSPLFVAGHGRAIVQAYRRASGSTQCLRTRTRVLPGGADRHRPLALTRSSDDHIRASKSALRSRPARAGALRRDGFHMTPLPSLSDDRTIRPTDTKAR